MQAVHCRVVWLGWWTVVSCRRLCELHCRPLFQRICGVSVRVLRSGSFCGTCWRQRVHQLCSRALLARVRRVLCRNVQSVPKRIHLRTGRECLRALPLRVLRGQQQSHGVHALQCRASFLGAGLQFFVVLRELSARLLRWRGFVVLQSMRAGVLLTGNYGGVRPLCCWNCVDCSEGYIVQCLHQLRCRAVLAGGCH